MKVLAPQYRSVLRGMRTYYLVISHFWSFEAAIEKSL